VKSHNLKHVGHLDLPGGGQVSVKDGIAYVGHMAPPIGTSIVDGSNPKAPWSWHNSRSRIDRHNGLDILERKK
jgi:hypothetical protein